MIGTIMSNIINESDLVKLIRQRKQKEDERPKELTDEQKEENTIHWITFYRRNMNTYAERYLGIKLHPFQHMMLYLMSVSQVFFAICSRGLSKSFMAGLFAVCKMMLYPYSEVHITSSTIPQAKKLMSEKIEGEICGKLSPILKEYVRRGLLTFKYSKEEIVCEFIPNHSKMWIDPCMDSARGGRATLLIYEECRLLKKGIIDSVFEKMAHPRQAIYYIHMNDDDSEKERWKEECQSVYITSARFTYEWFWRLFKQVVTETFMNKHIPYNFFCGNIFLSISNGLKTKADFFKSKKQSSDIDFLTEDLNVMVGEAEDAYYNREEFAKLQVIRKAYTFPTTEDIVYDKNLKNRKKDENEYRLLFIDLAFSNTTGKTDNDNTVIGCLSMIYNPEQLRVKRCCDYIITKGGSDSTGTQRLIREMFWDYKCDYIVMDLRNGGEVYATDLSKSWDHPERPSDLWNPHGFTVCDVNCLQVVSTEKLNDLRGRAVDPQAIPALIPIQGSPQFNNDMWIELKSCIKNSKIELLIDETEAVNQFEDNPANLTLSPEIRAEKLTPFIQVQGMINEAVNLSPEWREGKLKLKEPSSGYKDRIVAFAYGNYIATLLENKLNREYAGESTEKIDINVWQKIAEACKV